MKIIIEAIKYFIIPFLGTIWAYIVGAFNFTTSASSFIDIIETITKPMLIILSTAIILVKIIERILKAKK